MSHISIYRWAIVADLCIMLKKLQEFLFSLQFQREGENLSSTLSLPEICATRAQSSLLHDITIAVNKYWWQIQQNFMDPFS